MMILKSKLKFCYKNDLIFLPIQLYSKVIMPESTLKREARNVLWPILLVFVMFILATVFPATKHLSRDNPSDPPLYGRKQNVDGLQRLSADQQSADLYNPPGTPYNCGCPATAGNRNAGVLAAGPPARTIGGRPRVRLSQITMLRTILSCSEEPYT